MPNFQKQLENLNKDRQQLLDRLQEIRQVEAETLANLHRLEGAISITQSNLLEAQTEEE